MIINFNKKTGYIFLVIILFAIYKISATNKFYIPMELHSECWIEYKNSPKEFKSNSWDKNDEEPRFDLAFNTKNSSNYHSNLCDTGRIVCNYGGFIESSESNFDFVQMPTDDRKKVFQNAPDEYNILCDLRKFVNVKFCANARKLNCYENFILWLQDKINNDKKFRKKLAKMPGYEHSFSNFNDFVKEEADRIDKERKERANRIRLQQQEDAKIAEFKIWQENQPRLCINSNFTRQKLKPLYLKDDIQSARKALDTYRQRANALQKTLSDNCVCYDYSSQVKNPKFTDPYSDVFNNCYGTALDKQLHEELCDTRITMMDLQSTYVDNLQVRAFAPLIYQATAQAKVEKNIEKAFNLSDFSYDLVRIVAGGVRLMVLTLNNPEIAARGIASGLKTTCNPQHWVDVGMGLLKSFVLLADEDGRQDSLANSCLASAVLGTQDPFLKECDDYAKHSEAQMQAIRQEFYETSEKLKKMSDEELIEGVFSIGTTFFLDGVILKAGALAATVEGRELLSQWAGALNSPFAKEYVLNAAGIGKLTLEEGAETADRIVNVVVNNPELVADYNASVFSTSNITWSPENIPNGAIYKELAGIAPEVMPAQNLKHYFLGEIESEKGKLVLKGFHHAKSYPDRIKEIIIPCDVNGCYKARYVYNGLEKNSTFFPDHWNRITVMKKISEAYKNPISFSERGLLGKTSEGIKIQMWFLKNAKTGEKLIINSAYPIIE